MQNCPKRVIIKVVTGVKQRSRNVNFCWSNEPVSHGHGPMVTWSTDTDTPTLTFVHRVVDGIFGRERLARYPVLCSMTTFKFVLRVTSGSVQPF